MDMKWTLFLGILTVSLQIAGYISPGWLRISGVDIGLWYICKEGKCVSNLSLYDSLSGNITYFNYLFATVWREFQIEATIGLVAGIAGLFLSCALFRRNSQNIRILMYIACIAFLISGIAAWIPAGKFAQIHDVPAGFPIFETPYSVIFTALGATSALIDAIFVFVAVCIPERQPSDGHVTQPGYPMQSVQNQNQYTGYPASVNEYLDESGAGVVSEKICDIYQADFSNR